MSEPAKKFKNTFTWFPGKSDQFLKKEALKLVELERGLKFFNGQCEVYIANSSKIRQKAYELVYSLYSKKGFTRKKDSRLWLSIYDALPETTTFVAKNNRGPIKGALTAVFDSPIGLPADEIYQEEIDAIRNAGGQICEFISLGTKNSGTNSLKTLACLFYCAYLLAWRIKKSTHLVITVNPQHESFYCRKILFKKIGPERHFAKVNGAPSVLLNVPLEVYDRLKHKQRIFPFFMINHTHQDELEAACRIEHMVRPMSDAEFYTFLIEQTDVWEKALPQQKDFIKKVYPARETDHYEVSRALARGLSNKIRHSDDISENSCKAAR